MRSYYFLKNGQSVQRISLEGDPPGRVEELPVAIEPNCKINVSYNLSGNGLFPPSIFCHDQTTGDVFYYYFDDRGQYMKFPVGNIPPVWHLQVFRLYDQSGELGGTQIFGHYSLSDPSDPNFGHVRVWNLNTFPSFKDLGNLGGQWEFMLGDFNGDGIVDILGRRLFNTPQGQQGDLGIWFLGFGPDGLRINEIRSVGNIGLEWNLQVADMNFDGKADLFGYDQAGNLWTWYYITDASGVGRFNAGKSYGYLPDFLHLQVATLRTNHLDLFGIATNGEVHSWPLKSDGLRDNGANIGGGLGWVPLGGVPLTRVV